MTIQEWFSQRAYSSFGPRATTNALHRCWVTEKATIARRHDDDVEPQGGSRVLAAGCKQGNTGSAPWVIMQSLTEYYMQKYLHGIRNIEGSFKSNNET
jgi:hypothetical protein